MLALRLMTFRLGRCCVRPAPAPPAKHDTAKRDTIFFLISIFWFVFVAIMPAFMWLGH